MEHIRISNYVMTGEPIEIYHISEVHTGAFETSWMLRAYRDLVQVEIAKQLEPTELGLNELKAWAHGGSKANSLTPKGYLGNPANMDLNKMEEIEHLIIDSYSKTIMEKIKSKRQYLK